jgi:hypothetical protein
VKLQEVGPVSNRTLAPFVGQLSRHMCRFYDRRKIHSRRSAPRPVKALEDHPALLWRQARRRVCYKEVSKVLWQGGLGRRLLRLFVVAPTPYRKRSSGRFYYRLPAYLLSIDVAFVPFEPVLAQQGPKLIPEIFDP